MRVTVTFMGALGSFIGQNKVEFELPGQALYGDLMKEIGRRFSPRFPKGLWSSEKNDFIKGVLVIGSGRDLSDHQTPLKDGEDIKLVLTSAGG